MKKIVTTMIAVVLLLLGTYHGYNYYNGPKITDGVMSKKINGKGKPADATNTFSQKDTVYFSAKKNRFWIKKAQVVWYKGNITAANRFLVEEDVKVNKGGYFTTKLSVPKGLEEGQYGVTIYVDGRDIMETQAKFEVKP